MKSSPVARFIAGAAATAALLAPGADLLAAPPPQPAADDVQKITAAMPTAAPATPKKPRRVLVYSATGGFYHGAIPWGNRCLEIMGEKTGAFAAVVSNDPDNFLPDRLAAFDAVVLNNTTGELLVPAKPKPPAKPDRTRFKSDAEFAGAEAKWQEQQAAFEKEMATFKPPPDRSAELRPALLAWLRGGKGVVGIHAATDCSYDWPEYGEMIGGWFSGHPWNEEVAIKNDDPANPINAAFDGQGFKVADEIYQFMRGDVYSRQHQRVLLSLDMTATSPQGKRPDNDYAVSWLKRYGGGRVFYCSLGHRNDIFWNPQILAHYLAGIQWALGDLDGVNEAPNPLPATATP